MSATQNPMFQQLQLLLTGYGYNFYGKREIARADDLLIRERASETLGQAVAVLSQQEADFTRKFIPPATREVPYPPREVMAALKEITRIKESLKDLAVKIRSMAVPAQDKTWLRFREEVSFLNMLVQIDYDLIKGTVDIRDAVLVLTAENWKESSPVGVLMPCITQIEQTVRQRQELLQIPA